MATLPMRCLGKAKPRHDFRTIHLSDVLVDRSVLAPAPPARDWDTLPDDIGIKGNDNAGDCGFAGRAAAIQLETANTCPAPVIIPDADILAAYSACTGYVAGDASTDNGVQLIDALKFFKNTGIGGHKIGAFVKVDIHNLDHLKIAINMFSHLYCGIGLPLAAQTPGPWKGPANLLGDNLPYSWGGHCVIWPTFDQSGGKFRTWGIKQPFDYQWWLDYADEAWAIVDNEWLTQAKPAPNGLDIVRLTNALSQL